MEVEILILKWVRKSRTRITNYVLKKQKVIDLAFPGGLTIKT